MAEPALPSVEDEIRQDEGVRSKPYRDIKGRWAIGVGFDLAANGYSQEQIDELRKGPGWSQLTINHMLDAAIHKVEAFIGSHLPWALKLDPIRYRVLINIAFNVGCGGLLKFSTFLKWVEAGKYSLAAEDLMDQKLAAKELPERYGRLAARISTGEYFSPPWTSQRDAHDGTLHQLQPSRP